MNIAVYHAFPPYVLRFLGMTIAEFHRNVQSPVVFSEDEDRVPPEVPTARHVFHFF